MRQEEFDRIGMQADKDYDKLDEKEKGIIKMNITLCERIMKEIRKMPIKSQRLAIAQTVLFWVTDEQLRDADEDRKKEIQMSIQLEFARIMSMIESREKLEEFQKLSHYEYRKWISDQYRNWLK